MADITEERLREIVGTPLSLAPAVCNYVDAWYFAAELLAARAQLQADDQRAWETLGKPEGTHDTTNVQRLCAEVERLRARVGWLDHLDTAEGRAMHASEVLRVASEELHADLREALSLLRNAELRSDLCDWETDNWDERYDALLAKHKETNQ